MLVLMHLGNLHPAAFLCGSRHCFQDGIHVMAISDIDCNLTVLRDRGQDIMRLDRHNITICNALLIRAAETRVIAVPGSCPLIDLEPALLGVAVVGIIQQLVNTGHFKLDRALAALDFIRKADRASNRNAAGRHGADAPILVFNDDINLVIGVNR